MLQPSDCQRRVGFFRSVLGVCGLALAAAGCSGPPVPETITTDGKPYANISLRLACPDPKFAAAVSPLVKSWAGRTGAQVEIVPGPLAADNPADAALLPPAEVGAWAERGEIVPVPLTLQDGKGFRWNEIVSPYRDRLARWGNRVFAVPVAGDGYVVVYRADWFADPQLSAKFRARFQREPAIPATWEDFAELAEAFRDLTGKPSLAALPADPNTLVDLFFRVAASYERTAITEVKGFAGKAGSRTEALSFQYDVDKGKPRLTTPGFVAAAGWLARVNACRATDGAADPVLAIKDGRAALALVNLRELAVLAGETGEMPARFGLARVPGTQGEKGTNYVPYLAGGWFGVVRTRCTNPSAAFDLLADLGGPERSLELVGAVGPGAGPYRNEHFDRALWLAYGFDSRRTAEFAEMLRAYLAPDVTNTTFVLRGPDHESHTAALAAELKEVAAGRQAAGVALKRADEAWSKLDAEHPKDVLRWRRLAAGLE